MDLKKYYSLAKEGKFIGIPLGKGLSNLSNHISGLQKGKIYTIASPPKTGKTTLINYGFVAMPALHALKNNLNIRFIYYSLEMPKIQQEFYLTSIYMAHFKPEIMTFELPKGLTKNGKTTIRVSPELLMGRLSSDQGTKIDVPENVEKYMFQVYERVTKKLFDKKIIEIIDIPDNPTGIYKDLIKYMKNLGTLNKTSKIGSFEKVAVYKPHDENLQVIVIIDHLRKLLYERNMGKKQVIDKMAEYEVILRNIFEISFINVIHLNRSFESIDRYKMFGDQLFPSSENIKDSGNLSEESDYVITMMNPNDDKYKLETHFGLPLYTEDGRLKYPHLRTVHLVESRWTNAPAHFRTLMDGATKTFKEFEIKN